MPQPRYIASLDESIEENQRLKAYQEEHLFKDRKRDLFETGR